VTYEDISYEVRGGIARITIQREARLNAFRGQTVEEMTDAFYCAWDDATVGVVVLRGAGSRAFCTGGDQKERQETGTYAFRRGGILGLHEVIRAIPKPVIAAVNGYAIGGGNVLQVLCDLAVAADTAVFGQVGPRVGSVDPGHGTAYLARLVGERKAREIWYLCRRYSAQEALAMGLINCVVPAVELDAEVERWCQEILDKSPGALRIAKASFKAETDHIAGISELGHVALDRYLESEEAREGVEAFVNKRPPNFRRFRRAKAPEEKS
jgi:dihydroxynaphthoic acid synthetase